MTIQTKRKISSAFANAACILIPVAVLGLIIMLVAFLLDAIFVAGCGALAFVCSLLLAFICIAVADTVI